LEVGGSRREKRENQKRGGLGIIRRGENKCFTEEN